MMNMGKSGGEKLLMLSPEIELKHATIKTWAPVGIHMSSL